MHTQTQLKMNKDKILTLKNVTKSSIWELQENDVFRLWEAAEKDADLKDYQNKYIAVIRSAFEMEPVTVDRPEVIDKLMARGFKIGMVVAGRVCLRASRTSSKVISTSAQLLFLLTA